VKVTELFNIKHPILQAPMAGVQGSELAIAVAQAGGLGALPCAMLTPEAMKRELHTIRMATTSPINVNFFCHQTPSPDVVQEDLWRSALRPYYLELGLDPDAIPEAPGRRPFDAEACDVLSEFEPEVVSFHFGLPNEQLLKRIRGWGGKIISSATTLEEAIWLQAKGVDAIIAQGLEAGGHRAMFLTDDVTQQKGLFSLLPQLLEHTSIPIIAAGGIASPKAVRAALTMGAAGVQVGTAYLLCPEAKTTSVHRQALKSSAADHTALTRLFSGRPARGIVNRIMRELGPLSSLPPAFPLASTAIAPLRAASEALNNADFTPLWAGQNVKGCQEIAAGELTHWLAGD